jgi:hypothetical protein
MVEPVKLMLKCDYALLVRCGPPQFNMQMNISTTLMHVVKEVINKFLLADLRKVGQTELICAYQGIGNK